MNSFPSSLISPFAISYADGKEIYFFRCIELQAIKRYHFFFFGSKGIYIFISIAKKTPRQVIQQ